MDLTPSTGLESTGQTGTFALMPLRSGQHPDFPAFSILPLEQERSGHINFYLYNPSAEIRRHSHWTCFQHRGNDWYLVHMGRQPKDVSSGIMTIEQLIREAYEQ